ncbi:MAG: NTP transferase domain-containing protein [Rhodoferax sp.]|nr:NTP transferase domain-containing protein [Rhodoferax sp.]
MMLFVLAGGFGTRLQTVVAEIPKALAPIGNAPFLRLQIQHWKSQGINSFSFLLHHQADQIIAFLQVEQSSGCLTDCEVHCIVEPRPMDTGGAVAYAVDHLQLAENFLVANSDTWLGAGIAELQSAKAPAMAVVELSDATRYGCVQFNPHHQVTGFQEKKDGQGGGWINAGLCMLNADLFDRWNRLPFSLERLTFPELVVRGRLEAVPLQTNFIDIGIPDDYYRFCRWIAAERKGPL